MPAPPPPRNARDNHVEMARLDRGDRYRIRFHSLFQIPDFFFLLLLLLLLFGECYYQTNLIIKQMQQCEKILRILLF